MTQPSSNTPDAALTQRIVQATQRRDTARDAEISLRTTARLAQEEANALMLEMKNTYGVKTLEELQALAKETYAKQLAEVEAYEKAVKDYVDTVEKAQALQNNQKS
jgi:hypothetical protein